MRRLASILAGLSLCGAFGYCLNRFVLSAESVVRRELSNICPQQTVPEDFHVLGTREWSKKLIVVYKVNCRDDRTASYNGKLLGHQVVVRKGMSWQAVGGGDHVGLLPEVPPGEIVQYATTRKQKEGIRPTVVYGEILTANVTAVEATFDNGKTLRDEGRDGMFAMALPETVEVREVRVLGVNGQVLQHDSNRQLTPIYFDNDADPVALSPEDAVRHAQSECSQPYTPESGVLGDFRILRTIKSAAGAFVLYRVICRNATTVITQALLYESFVRHKNSVWRTREMIFPEEDTLYKNENKRSVWQLSSNSLVGDYLHLPSGFVNYGLLYSRAVKGKDLDNYTSIAERAFTPEVTAVEATFGTGQALLDQVTNGAFLIVLPRVDKVCELKIRGVNGQVLQRLNTSSHC